MCMGTELQAIIFCRNAIKGGDVTLELLCDWLLWVYGHRRIDNFLRGNFLKPTMTDTLTTVVL
jgi:hypothetical protein